MQAKRDKILKVRLTEQELSKLLAQLVTNGKPARGLSTLVRTRLFSPRRQSNHPPDCKHCRLLACLTNNLNLIARRAENIPNPETVVEVLARLTSLDRDVKQLLDPAQRK
jgi:hypothetical protein